MNKENLIIPVFLANEGCPNRCIFCHERKIAGDRPDEITEESLLSIVRRYTNNSRRVKGRRQIAFYGGNFTGLSRENQQKLLLSAAFYIQNGEVDSIRVSTRPDYVDRESLELLRRYHVRTVEIGAQSMDGDVLVRSHRGHTSDDVKRAVNLLKNLGFETGIHLMTGLPGEDESSFEDSVLEVIRLRPDMVRIHPTLVFENTELSAMYKRGEYRPLTVQEAVDRCKQALRKFAEARIPVIRLGLQTTAEMERAGAVIAGPYHPAFRSLVEGALFLDRTSSLAGKAEDLSCLSFFISPEDISNFRGIGNGNLNTLRNRFGIRNFPVLPDASLRRGTIVMKAGSHSYEGNIFDRISESAY